PMRFTARCIEEVERTVGSSNEAIDAHADKHGRLHPRSFLTPAEESGSSSTVNRNATSSPPKPAAAVKFSVQNAPFLPLGRPRVGISTRTGNMLRPASTDAAADP